MPMQFDEIKQTYETLRPQLKLLDPTITNKKITLTKTALQKAWDEEEKFIKAFKAAQKIRPER